MALTCATVWSCSLFFAELQALKVSALLAEALPFSLCSNMGLMVPPNLPDLRGPDLVARPRVACEVQNNTASMCDRAVEATIQHPHPVAAVALWLAVSAAFRAAAVDFCIPISICRAAQKQ